MRRNGVSGQRRMGQHHHIHAAHCFELNDQPVSIVMAMTGKVCERLFARLRAKRVELFCVKAAIEFGTV
ncbi:MAG TPA: hypothetical protein VK130_11305 [Steroidobacteraceae bacterium]|nr:hypothetical protein [Steroidobacteraceae bacterium]